MKIDLHRAEGPIAECSPHSYETWDAAEAKIRAWAATAPADGSCHKVDVGIDLEGIGIALVFDLERKHTNPAVPHLFVEVRSHVRFYAGLYRPEHITEASYEELLGEVGVRAVRDTFTQVAAILEKRWKAMTMACTGPGCAACRAVAGASWAGSCAHARREKNMPDEYKIALLEDLIDRITTFEATGGGGGAALALLREIREELRKLRAALV